MSKVIIDIRDKSKEKTFVDFLKSIPFITVQENKKTVIKSKIDFRKSFGIWMDRDISLKSIRDRAWTRLR